MSADFLLRALNDMRVTQRREFLPQVLVTKGSILNTWLELEQKAPEYEPDAVYTVTKNGVTRHDA